MSRPALSWRTLPAAGRWRVATWTLLAAAGLAVVATFRDYGSTWDEGFQAELGRDVVAWFASAGRDARAVSGGSMGNLHLYGGAFEAAAELAGRAAPLDPLETRHLVNALVALVGAAGAALLARRLGGWRAAFFAAALLVTTPPWWGHGFANSKDVPFAAAYPWALLALLRASDELPRPGRRRVAAAGLAVGAGLAVRPGGLVLLLPLAVLIVFVRLLPVLRDAGPAGRARAVAAASVRLAGIAAIAWVAMVGLWPYGLENPIRGPFAAVEAARSFEWRGLVRFAGGWLPAYDLPRSYAATWFLATLPETWVAIAAAGAVAALVAWRRDRVRPALEPGWLDPALVAAAGLGPIVAAAVLRPVLYDGVRHLLFVLPALAAVAGWALSAAVARLPRAGAAVALAGTAAAALLAVADAVRLHPYQYVYFNRAGAGGLGGASGAYELDYWGATGREAMAWVAANVAPAPDRRLVVATTADPSVASHWIERDPVLRTRFMFDRMDAADGAPDLLLATTRWFAHRATGRVLHVVERMGVPLLYVIAATPDAPLVLEGGDAAVALPPSAGWWGRAHVEPGVEGAAYLLTRGTAERATAQAWVLTPGNGGVPAFEDLRGDVVRLAADLLGTRPDPRAAERVAGPGARGWIVASGGRGPGDPYSAVAAAHVGGAAVVLYARYAADAEGASGEMLAWIRGARLAQPAERRRP